MNILHFMYRCLCRLFLIPISRSMLLLVQRRLEKKEIYYSSLFAWKLRNSQVRLNWMSLQAVTNTSTFGNDTFWILFKSYCNTVQAESTTLLAQIQRRYSHTLSLIQKYATVVEWKKVAEIKSHCPVTSSTDEFFILLFTCIKAYMQKDIESVAYRVH